VEVGDFVHPGRKPTWQQATALVSLSTCGAMTGFAFAHGTVGEMTSPTRMPVSLMALKKAAAPATPSVSAQPSRAMSTSEKAMRAAVVKVARYYLRMAQTKSPAEMEALIWGQDSVDGTDHGQSCAAFASLTLALGAQATGQESWVTGGSTYPWPLRQWADVRVDTNPDSPQITSVMQDAQAHDRWHPLGDGYRPQPGDWVLFEGHVEVVTRYAGGVLSTIGGDSAPNLSVNAHTFTGSLADQGVTGFVNNGRLAGAASPAGNSTASASAGSSSTGSSSTGSSSTGGGAAQAVTAGIVEQGNPATAGAGGAVVPGTGTAVLTPAGKGATRMVGTAGRTQAASTVGTVTVPGLMADLAAGNSQAPAAKAGASQASGSPGAASQSRAAQKRTTPGGAAPSRAKAAKGRGSRAQASGAAAIPGLQSGLTGTTGQSGAAAKASKASTASSSATPSYTRNNPPKAASHVPDTLSQQAFISAIAPGAMAAQSRYGVPAAVTIAQAIDESGWGQSALAIRDHNLFGIKGTGPAGSDALPTREFENGQWVTVTAQFRVYHNVAESIADHSELLATGPSYQHAMANRHIPDAFATNLTGIYATDPQYGTTLITIMKLYNLYRYDASTAPAAQPAPSSQVTAIPAASIPGAPAPSAAASPSPSSVPVAPAPSAHAAPSASAHAAPVAAASAAAGHDGGRTASANRGSASGSRGTANRSQGAASRSPGTTNGSRGTDSGSRGTGSGSRAAGSGARGAGSGSYGTATIPGVLDAYSAGPDHQAPAAAGALAGAVLAGSGLTRAAAARRRSPRPEARVTPRRPRMIRYVPQLPPTVTAAFAATAEAPLSRAEPLYDEVADYTGIRWELLAACDWMQCQARPRYSPVYGEKLGTAGAGGTVYRTKSEALTQCATDLIELAMAVYWIDITARRPLSVRELARVFAAFRWGGLLKLHDISAMEFPYSVEGLTAQHVKMRWPDLKDPNAPDKPGTRFRQPFGAVPVVLSLGYPAIA
jgi:flagellum-specific peptidoglycan hydrolase FlgJ